MSSLTDCSTPNEGKMAQMRCSGRYKLVLPDEQASEERSNAGGLSPRPCRYRITGARNYVGLVVGTLAKPLPPISP